MSEVEHTIKVESTQVYRGEVTPDMSDFLTSDGVERNAFGRVTKNVGFQLQFHDEIKLTFECSCGKKFRKGETAREHLENES